MWSGSEFTRGFSRLSRRTGGFSPGRKFCKQRERVSRVLFASTVTFVKTRSRHASMYLN